MGWLVNAMSSGKDPVPTVQEAGWAPGPVWTGAKILTLTGIRSPESQARSVSLFNFLCITFSFSSSFPFKFFFVSISLILSIRLSLFPFSSSYSYLLMYVCVCFLASKMKWDLAPLNYVSSNGPHVPAEMNVITVYVYGLLRLTPCSLVGKRIFITTQQAIPITQNPTIYHYKNLRP
jgi:hypothetical protein